MTYLSSGSLPDDETLGKLDSSASGGTAQPGKQKQNKNTVIFLVSEQTQQRLLWHFI